MLTDDQIRDCMCECDLLKAGRNVEKLVLEQFAEIRLAADVLDQAFIDFYVLIKSDEFTIFEKKSLAKGTLNEMVKASKKYRELTRLRRVK